MAGKVEELVQIGKKIKQFRETNGFSLVNFAIITGVSSPTLSRIENAGRYSQGKLDAICEIMGIPASQLPTVDLSKISKEETAERIAAQVKKKGIKRTEFNQINRERKTFHGPSYLVRQTMQDGFLNQFRQVNEIQRYIKEEYGVSLKSTSITNALDRKEGIVNKPSGVAKYKLYRFLHKKKNAK